MRQLKPSPALAPVVRHFTIVETDEAATRLLMPTPSLMLGVRYRGYAEQREGNTPYRLPQATLAGLRDTARLMHTSAQGGIVLAALQPASAAQLFTLPGPSLLNTTVDLARLVPADELAVLPEALTAAEDDGQRVACLERFLHARLQQARCPPDQLVAEAVRAIERSHGAVRIGSLAAALGIGLDRLEKRFRAAMGATPKQLAGIVRLQHAVSLYGDAASLAQLSADAGYADQSHFIRSFRAVAGAAPQRVLQAGDYC